MSIIDGLNPEQRDAASTFDGPVLVLAGAGTGKTRVITSRIAYMIDCGIDPASILGVTFTNKAAREMRERLARIVAPDSARAVTLGTFHSFCGRVLRRDIRYAGNYDANYSIADEADQTALVRQAAAELGIPKDEAPAKDALAFISRSKNAMLFPAEAEAGALPDEALYAEIYGRYQKLLELQNTVDFDDMLILVLKIFREHSEILKYYTDKYKYLLVDEYQDTNAAQFELVRLLAGEKRNLCVVGDDDQSIYAWRGADVKNILDFPSYFPGAKEVRLEQNYRSTNKILGAANAVISKNLRRYGKNLWSAKGDGENIRIVGLENGDSEARFVVDAIQNIRRINPDYNFSDFAILYRSNYLSRTFEQAFRERGIRPRIIGGQEFFQRKEVKDAAAYLKLVMNFRDNQSLLRVIGVPPRGMGDKAIETLRQMCRVTSVPMTKLLLEPDYASKVTAAAGGAGARLGHEFEKYTSIFSEGGELAKKVEAYLSDVGYLGGFQRIYKDINEARNRFENVGEFISYIGQFEMAHPGCTLADFMESYSLMDENDRTDDDDRDAPIMSTVHASKGLEFPVVFIVGMENNLFPHERALAEGSEDEERRLFYVAITRAREQLFMTYSRKRFKYHEMERRTPSKFLRDIPDGLADKPSAEELFGGEASDAEKMKTFEDILKRLKASLDD